MGLVLRYALLVALLIVSVLAFFGATVVTGERMLVDVGSGGEHRNVGFWVLMAMGAAVAVSLGRGFLSEVPAAIVDLWHDNKDRVFTLALGAIVCAVFLLS